MHQLITGSDTSIPAVCYARWYMVSVAVLQMGMTELIFVNHGVKLNSQYYCYYVLLSQQLLPAIKRVSKRCLFTKQCVAYGEIGHFLCCVISPSSCTR